MLMDFIERSWMPLAIGLVVLYFAYRVIVLKDTSVIRSKGKPDPKDKEGYCNDAGKLLILFGVGALLMGVLAAISPVASFVEMILCTLATVALWKRLNDKLDSCETRSVSGRS